MLTVDGLADLGCSKKKNMWMFKCYKGKFPLKWMKKGGYPYFRGEDVQCNIKFPARDGDMARIDRLHVLHAAGCV